MFWLVFLTVFLDFFMLLIEYFLYYAPLYCAYSNLWLVKWEVNVNLRENIVRANIVYGYEDLLQLKIMFIYFIDCFCYF